MKHKWLVLIFFGIFSGFAFSAQSQEAASSAKPTENTGTGSFFPAGHVPEPVPGLQPAANPNASVKEILAGCDKITYGYDDSWMDVKMIIREADGTEKFYLLDLFQKGMYKRLISFKSAEAKGMKVLFRSQDEMYIYLPSFKRVRRLAQHNMKEKFMGSDVTNQEMGSVWYATDYTGKMVKQDDEFWWIEVKPNPGISDPFVKRVLQIHKKRYDLIGTDFFEKGRDTPIKRMYVDPKYMKYGNIWRTPSITWRDLDTGHETTTEVLNLKVNQGLKDKIFTKRNLQWGR